MVKTIYWYEYSTDTKHKKISSKKTFSSKRITFWQNNGKCKEV